MAVEITLLHRGDESVLANVLPGVFDRPIDRGLYSEFLSDPRHHLAVAVDGGVVVRMASAVHYVHPDKPAQLWNNEVGVVPAYRRQGVAKRMLEALLETGRQLGCGEAWVLTDRPNTAAVRLYESLGGKDADQVMFSFDLDGTPSHAEDA